MKRWAETPSGQHVKSGDNFMVIFAPAIPKEVLRFLKTKMNAVIGDGDFEVEDNQDRTVIGRFVDNKSSTYGLKGDHREALDSLIENSFEEVFAYYNAHPELHDNPDEKEGPGFMNSGKKRRKCNHQVQAVKVGPGFLG